MCLLLAHKECEYPNADETIERARKYYEWAMGKESDSLTVEN